eukprot:CAMPEP_0119550286 /NCGR_PEP_ID=MMETSP1352-20130426/3820_1 /TAXON_ID=265584 /ORGANISM="Stauroneis constricta, Strain CCMP1120" /LENGTH=2316 /DNA_ID=CAMNT_0007596081 /DNA_START=18 /DNA_END=6965 /DNA_ORIENTATION=+
MSDAAPPPSGDDEKDDDRDRGHDDDHEDHQATTAAGEEDDGRDGDVANGDPPKASGNVDHHQDHENEGIVAASDIILEYVDDDDDDGVATTRMADSQQSNSNSNSGKPSNGEGKTDGVEDGTANTNPHSPSPNINGAAVDDSSNDYEDDDENLVILKRVTLANTTTTPQQNTARFRRRLEAKKLQDAHEDSGTAIKSGATGRASIMRRSIRQSMRQTRQRRSLHQGQTKASQSHAAPDLKTTLKFDAHDELDDDDDDDDNDDSYSTDDNPVAVTTLMRGTTQLTAKEVLDLVETASVNDDHTNATADHDDDDDGANTKTIELQNARMDSLSTAKQTLAFLEDGRSAAAATTVTDISKNSHASSNMLVYHEGDDEDDNLDDVVFLGAVPYGRDVETASSNLDDISENLFSANGETAGTLSTLSSSRDQNLAVAQEVHENANYPATGSARAHQRDEIVRQAERDATRRLQQELDENALQVEATTAEEAEKRARAAAKRRMRKALGLVACAAIAIAIAVGVLVSTRCDWNPNGSGCGNSVGRNIKPFEHDACSSPMKLQSATSQNGTGNGNNKDDIVNMQFNTFGATPSSVDASTCATTNGNFDVLSTTEDDAAKPGMWFEVVGTGLPMEFATTMKITFDASIMVFQDSCDALQCVASSSDCRNGCSVVWSTTANVAYSIFVQGIQEFAFAATLRETVANDVCATATVMPMPIDEDAIISPSGMLLSKNTVSGSNQAASVTAVPNCQDGNGGNGLLQGPGTWHTVKGIGGPMLASLCDDQAATEIDSTAAGDKTLLVLLSGSGCADLSCPAVATGEYGTSDQFTYIDCGSKNEVVWNSIANETYYLAVISVVGGSENNINGQAGSSISSSNIETTSAPSAPFEYQLTIQQNQPNDLCTTARSVVLTTNDTIVQGSNRRTTNDKSMVERASSSCTGVISSEEAGGGDDAQQLNSKGSWFHVVGTGGLAFASLCDFANNSEHLSIQVFEGDCSNLKCPDQAYYHPCWPSSTNKYKKRVHWMTENGKDYHILVQSNIGSNVTDTDTDDLNFDLMIKEVAQNDVCETATPLPFGTNQSWSTIEHATYQPIETAADSECVLDGAFHGGIGVWFSYMGTERRNMKASTCQPGTCQSYILRRQLSNFHLPSNEQNDRKMYIPCADMGFLDGEVPTFVMIYSGSTCGELECVSAATFICGNQSSATFQEEPGKLYHILVTGEFNKTGNFTMTIDRTITSTKHDTCEDAYTISPEDDWEHSTSTARSDRARLCNGLFATGPGIWATFDGTGDYLRVTTIMGNLIESGQLLDANIALFEGTSCGDLQCVDDAVYGENEGIYTVHPTAFIDFHAEVGKKYFVLVYGTSEEERGRFVLSIRRRDTHIFCDGATMLQPNGAFVRTKMDEALPEDEEYPLCGVGDPGITFGVWFTAYGTGRTLILEVLALYDIQLSVHTETSGNVGCDYLACKVSKSIEDPETWPLSLRRDAILWNTIEGRLYYIYMSVKYDPNSFYIYHYATPQIILFENAGIPRNSECSAATPLEVGTSTIGSTRFSTVANTIGCGDAGRAGTASVWYSIVGTGNTLTLSTCSDDNYVYYDTQISVFDGCPSTTTVNGNNCVAGNDQYCSSQSQVTFQSQLGVEYKIHVYGHRGDAPVGDFNLTVSEETVPIPLAENNECDGAIALAVGGEVVFGSTSLATTSPNGRCGDIGDGVGSGLWYSIIGSGSIMTASTCPTSDLIVPASSIFVHTGSCSDLECLEYSTNSYTCYQDTGITWYARPGTQYFIYVETDARSESNNDFMLTLSSRENEGSPMCTDNMASLPYGSFRVNAVTVGRFGDTKVLADGSGNIAMIPSNIESTSGTWFSFVGAGKGVKFSSCDIYAKTFDLSMLIFTGSSCDSSLTYVDTVQSDCSVITAFERDQNYFVYMFDASGGEGGVFSLDIISVPRNDVCEYATLITPGGDPILDNAEGAIDEDPYTINGCNSIGNTMYYRVVGTGKVIKIHAEEDVSIEIGDCASLHCLGANRRSDRWASVEGREYTVKLATFATEVQLLLTEQDDLSFADECTDVDTYLELDTNVVSYTSSASVDDDVLDCKTGLPHSTRGAWYKVKGTGAVLRAATCENDETDFDLNMHVYKGAGSTSTTGATNSCGEDLECVDLVDDIACIARGFSVSQVGRIVTWESEAGEDYYILINGMANSMDDVGIFELTVTEVPDSELGGCEAATDLILENGFVTINSSLDGAARHTFETCECYEPEEPVSLVSEWFRFKNTGDYPVSLDTSICPIDSGVAISVFYEDGPSCNSLTCHKDDSCQNPYWLAECDHVTISV